MVFYSRSCNLSTLNCKFFCIFLDLAACFQYNGKWIFYFYMISAKCFPCLEVKIINKQNFLTELGKFLTFMSDEDRSTTLIMYSRIFDEIDDDQVLLQQLMSPTRQAVVLARNYSSRSGKSGERPSEKPKYVSVIEEIEQKALAAQEERRPRISSDQISMFEDAAPDDLPEMKEIYSRAAAAAAAVSPSASQAEETAVPAEAEEAAPAESEGENESEPAFILPAVSPLSDSDEDPGASDVAADAEEADDSESSDDTEARRQAAVDAFMDDFSIDEHEEADTEEDESLPAEESENEEDEEEESGYYEDEAVPAPVVEFIEEDEEEEEAPAPVRKIKTKKHTEPAPEPAAPRKVIVPLLILFLIVAIPVSLLVLALLLIPTTVVLTAAAIAIGFGALALTAAFSGFAVFADILVVLGAALLLLAFGLLFLWIFVWLIGGVMVSFVKSVVRLGKRLCTKEEHA